MAGPFLGVGIVVLIGAVIIGALVVTAVATVVRWRDRVRVPSCGACRYPVEGLTSFTCPECGADLRETGILAPGMRPKHRIFVAEMFAAWAVVAVVGMLITSGILGSSSLGQRMSFSRNVTLAAKSNAVPMIAVTLSGTAAADTSANAAPAQRLVIQAAQTTVASPMLLDVDLVRGTWERRPAAGPMAGKPPVRGALPVTEGDVAAWMISAGVVNAESAAPAAEAKSLVEYINGGGRLADELSFGSAGGGMGVTYAPASWVFAASAGIWIVIFVVGCVLIAKANSTRKRRAPTVAGAAG